MWVIYKVYSKRNQTFEIAHQPAEEAHCSYSAHVEVGLDNKLPFAEFHYDRQNSDEEEDLGGSSSETEDYLEVRESNSESDQSADESEGSTEGTDDDLHFFMGRDGHSWINKPCRQAARVTATNIIPPMHAPGVLNLAKQLNQLRKRVDELSRRAQQLANLLREAGITIPNVLPDTDEVIPKWDNKTQNASVLHEKAKKSDVTAWRGMPSLAHTPTCLLVADWSSRLV
uniref:Uncharacterized protein n=1 Tax=Timema monikensis TaxID=170555 RepID=A0A7R9EG88_9NEOP|nr:unnamed protein product [Timema monikensis]